jgi:hypothetical protein
MDMQSTFQASDSGQAVIENSSAAGTEQLVVSLHPGSDSSIHIQIKENALGGLVSSAISINRDNLQKLVDWLRGQGAVE